MVCFDVSCPRRRWAATRIFVETNVRFDRISTKLVLDNVVFIHAGNRIIRGDTFLSFEFFFWDAPYLRMIRMFCSY